jgi:hypothetical protein
MQEIQEQLELVDVTFEDNNQKAVLTFLNPDLGQIREVNFNKQTFDAKTTKFIADPEKAAKVEEWCQEYFGLTFDRLGEAIGEKRDVFCYDNFNSLWEVRMLSKFEDDYEGQILDVVICEAVDDGKKISLQFEYEGKLYESKMQYAKYLDVRKEWLVDPVKRDKQYKKFEEKFQMPVSDLQNMIGKEVLVEVKKLGEHTYCEIKPFKKPAKSKK